MKIRKFKPKDVKSVKTIINSLHPKWFDKKALIKIPKDVKKYDTYLIEDKRKIKGFITIKHKQKETEIAWIGIDPQFHRKGMGRELIRKAEGVAKTKTLVVKTVGESKPSYKPYQQTVKFYKSVGFGVSKKSNPKKDSGYIFRMYTFSKNI